MFMGTLEEALRIQERITSLSIYGFQGTSRISEGLGSVTLYLNKPTELPEEIRGLQSLESIQLSFCGKLNYSTVFRELLAFPALNYLFFSRCSLTAIPPEIGLLTQIQGLSFGNERCDELENNVLSSLPPEIGLLTNLEDLMLCNLYKNLTVLPAEVGRLSKLKKVALCGSRLLDNLELIPNLTELDLTDAFFSLEDLIVLLKKRDRLRRIQLREGRATDGLEKSFPDLVIEIEPLPIDNFY